jgi:hypothetical protein
MSTECEYPVTILGNPRETIDVSEVADFIDELTTTAKGRNEPKKTRMASVSLTGCVVAGSPRHREDFLTFKHKAYMNGAF